MTLDLISRAEARIAEIDQQRKELEYEQHELETAIRVLHRFLDETASPGEKIIDGMQEALAVARGEEEPARVHTVPQPSPAAQTGDEQLVSSSPAAVAGSVEAAPASVESAASNPVANVEKEANGAIAVASDDPASREIDGADRQQPATSGFTGEGEVAPVVLPTHSPAPVTLTRKIVRKSVKRDIFERCHAEHPDWPVKLVVEHTGLPKGTVTGYAAKLGIKMPSLAEYEAAQRAKTTEALKAPAPAEPPSAPTSGPENEPKPYHLTHRPVLKAKAGTKFYLRDRATGHYLHCSVTLNRSGTPLLTTEKVYAWQGTEAHMLAVRKKMPATIDFLEQVVEKEPVRA